MSPQCSLCRAFFARFRCNSPGECDCPRCQGSCRCASTYVVEDQVFRDPANRSEEAWRVCWNGLVLPPSFGSKGAAQAHLDGLRAGRKES